MAKIWILAFIPISEIRNSTIEALLHEKSSGDNFDGTFQYHWGNSHRLEDSFSVRTKKFKTLSGARRSVTLLTKKFSNRSIYYRRGYWENRKYINNVVFDSSKYKLIPVEISEKWNKSIDEMIDIKKKIYDNEVKRLLQRKV